MSDDIYLDLENRLRDLGPNAAIDRLCADLEERKVYDSLFYALLLKKRVELGVSPVPTESAQALPEAAHEAYEEAIRDAGRRVGHLYLADGNIPQSWLYFRMIGEPAPIEAALAGHEPKEDEDCQALVEIAFHQGVHPRRGFDWILSRYGICNAITTATSTQFPRPDVREYCIRGLVRALYDQLRQRLADDAAQRHGGQVSPASVAELLAAHPDIVQEDYYHIDVSHLGSVVQMSIQLPDGPELLQALEMCGYGERMSSRFQYPGSPPFEDQYRDYRIYLEILLGRRVNDGIQHFQDKLKSYDLYEVGTQPAEVLINLFLRLGRPTDALAVARKYLAGPEITSSSGCPPLPELCRLADDYHTLAEVAKERGDPVHYLAGLLAAQGGRTA